MRHTCIACRHISKSAHHRNNAPLNANQTPLSCKTLRDRLLKREALMTFVFQARWKSTAVGPMWDPKDATRLQIMHELISESIRHDIGHAAYELRFPVTVSMLVVADTADSLSSLPTSTLQQAIHTVAGSAGIAFNATLLSHSVSLVAKAAPMVSISTTSTATSTTTSTTIRPLRAKLSKLLLMKLSF